jgi:hypothetical protein
MASHWISIHEPDHIKKCVNDIQDLLLAKPTVCHYHALNVLYNIKKNDMMSFIKVASTMTADSVVNHYQEQQL